MVASVGRHGPFRLPLSAGGISSRDAFGFWLLYLLTDSITGYLAGVWLHYLSHKSLSRLGSIEILSRSSLDRGKFLTRYRSRRANFLVSFALKTLFAYTKDTLCVSKSLDTVSVSRSPTQISCIGNSLGQIHIS